MLVSLPHTDYQFVLVCLLHFYFCSRKLAGISVAPVTVFIPIFLTDIRIIYNVIKEKGDA